MSGERYLTDDNPGGKPIKPAQLVSDGVDGVRTTRMLERAIRQRWPITDEQRQAIIDRQIVIASRKTGKAREQSIAAKTVAAFDRMNMDEEKASSPQPPQQHVHLHSEVNLDNLSVKQLEELEQLLLAANANTTIGTGANKAG